MKIVIFGLGNFGMALAIHLSDSDNEVIAVDRDVKKIELIKDKVAHAVALDSTNESAYHALPLKNIDIAVIAIGEDEGATIMTTAIVKNYCKARIITRSSSAVQDRIFEAMGVDQIIHPEQEYAEQLTKKINLRGSIDNFEIDGEYMVSEVPVAPVVIGKTLVQADFRKSHDLNIITILRNRKYTNLIGRKAKKQEVIGMPKPDTVFMENDVLVVFGKSGSIDKYLKKHHIHEIHP